MNTRARAPREIVGPLGLGVNTLLWLVEPKPYSGSSVPATMRYLHSNLEAKVRQSHNSRRTVTIPCQLPSLAITAASLIVSRPSRRTCWPRFQSG